jgi:hypothetical protein
MKLKRVERKNSKKAGAKRKLWGRSDKRFTSTGRKNITLLEGSQASPASPSKPRMNDI